MRDTRLRCRYCGDVCITYARGIGSCYDCGAPAWASTCVVHPRIIEDLLATMPDMPPTPDERSNETHLT